jgi:hypothetical protein
VTRLSSLQTFVSKFIFPLIWIGWTVFGTMKSIKVVDPKSWLAGFAFWLGFSGFIYWSCVRLKKVSIDDQYLYVSNYLREIAIPFSAIGDVTYNWWLNSHPVTIYFKEPTEFGDKIVFMPRFRFFPFLGPHPDVERLRRLAKID